MSETIIAAQPEFYVLTLVATANDELPEIQARAVIGWVVEDGAAEPLTILGIYKDAAILSPNGLIESSAGWCTRMKDWVEQEMKEAPDKYAAYLSNLDFWHVRGPDKGVFKVEVTRPFLAA